MRQFFYSSTVEQYYVCEQIDEEYVFCRHVPVVEYVMYYLDSEDEFYFDDNQVKWLCLYKTTSKDDMKKYLEKFITIEEITPNVSSKVIFEVGQMAKMA